MATVEQIEQWALDASLAFDPKVGQADDIIRLAHDMARGGFRSGFLAGYLKAVMEDEKARSNVSQKG